MTSEIVIVSLAILDVHVCPSEYVSVIVKSYVPVAFASIVLSVPLFAPLQEYEYAFPVKFADNVYEH